MMKWNSELGAFSCSLLIIVVLAAILIGVFALEHPKVHGKRAGQELLK
jgi:hypothetical membrane protein